MKERTKEELSDRMRAVNRAMAIFGELTDNHITKAFQAYQLIFAERERELFYASPSNLHQPRKYETLKCTECGRELFFKKLEPNDEGYQSQWVCSNPDCDTVYNSKEDMAWWMDKLKIKDTHEQISRPVDGIVPQQQEGRRPRNRGRRTR